LWKEIPRIYCFQSWTFGCRTFILPFIPSAQVYIVLDRNFLEIKSFEILGTASDSLNSFGPISIASCIFLGISTSTISDGPGDMNFTLHTIGATGFFILGLLLALKASKIYRKLWSVRNNFVPKWSYQIKKYSNFILASIILL